MAIITKCCCFDNVRTGSYVCGIYTLIYALLGFIYFAVNIVQTANANDARTYFVTSIVGMIFWGLAFITAIFMMIGVYQDLKQMLIPYIIVKALIILLQGILLVIYIIELVRFFYWIALFFVLMVTATIIVNVMCFLCVVSQYQELRDGRGMGF